MQLSQLRTPPTAAIERRANASALSAISPRVASPRLVEDSAWLDLCSFVARNYGVLLACLVLGSLMAYLVTISQTPTYRASATIEIQDLNENFLNMREVSPVASLVPAAGAGDVQTQLRILQSNSLIARVLEKLPVETVPPAAGIRKWTVSAIAKLRGARPVPAPDQDARIEAARANLQVRETRQSRIVDLTYEGPDAKYAAAFVNQLAQQYVDQGVESRIEMTRSTSDWLEKQLGDVRGKLAGSEKQLQDYARKTGLLVTTEEHRPDEEKLRQIQESLSKAQENRMMKQARMETAAKSPLDSIEVPAGSALRDHQAKLADLRRQRADLMTVFTPDFDGVRRIDSQIASLEVSLRTETTSLLQGIRNEYDDAIRRESLLQDGYRDQVGRVTEQAGIAIQYGILKREADTSRELYNVMLQRTAEAKVASAMRASIARLVDPAKAPPRPFRPSTLLNFAWGATAGLLLGLVLVTARDRSDRRIKAPGDLSMRLNLAELGSVPLVKPLALNSALGGESGIVKVDGATPGRLESVAFETWNRRSSPAASSYRAVLTSILFSQQAGRTPQVIVVTSASRGEGKTALVANLAAALAQAKQTVLLVDAAGNRSLQSVFHHSNDYGLSDILDLPGDSSDLLPYITSATCMEGVSLVATGPKDTSALDLLYAQSMGRILEQMRQAYDVVLIDTAALDESPDARVFARMADGVVLAVRAGQTTLDAAQSVAARLQEDGSLLLGTVLNHIR